MKFSFVLPTYNRAHILPNAIQGLLAIEYKKSDFEIVIVDNNSTDDTAQVVKKLASKHKNIRYLFEKRQGRTFASLTGMEAARFPLIVFIDDDIAVKKDLLHIYEKYFAKFPHAALIGGPIFAKWQDMDSLPWYVEVLKKHEPWLFGEISYGKKAKQLHYPDALFAGNFALNLKEFKTVEDTFYQSLGRKVGQRYLYAEDYELCLRLGLEGKTQVYVPELAVENLVERERATFSYLMKRLINSGIENYIIDQKLASYPGYELLVPKLGLYFWNLLRSRTSYALTELLIRFPILWGYYRYGSAVEKSAKLKV